MHKKCDIHFHLPPPYPDLTRSRGCCNPSRMIPWSNQGIATWSAGILLLDGNMDVLLLFGFACPVHVSTLLCRRIPTRGQHDGHNTTQRGSEARNEAVWQRGAQRRTRQCGSEARSVSAKVLEAHMSDVSLFLLGFAWDEVSSSDFKNVSPVYFVWCLRMCMCQLCSVVAFQPRRVVSMMVTARRMATRQCGSEARSVSAKVLGTDVNPRGTPPHPHTPPSLSL